MTHTTDGKSYVFAVFDYDGYECRELVAVFASSERAMQEAARLGEEDRLRHAKERPGFVNRREFTMEMLEVGQ